MNIRIVGVQGILLRETRICCIVIAGKSIYLTGSFTSINNYALGGRFAAFSDRPELATNTIKGNIFNDLNSNCVKEQTESLLPNMIVVVQPGNFYASTDPSGNYEIIVPSGKYQVSQVLPQVKGFDISQLCPITPTYDIEFSSKNGVITDKNFALRLKARDLPPVCYIKTLVSWHEGKIWFESEENKGTRFFIEMPKE